LRTFSRFNNRQLHFLIGLAASRLTVSGNYMLRRLKHLKNEVIAPKEEEEEEVTFFFISLMLHMYCVCVL
jgi:hypothetical protein